MKPEAQIIASACLCGIPCRYDGSANTHEDLARLYQQGRVLPVCPEVDGGLATPRPPCEIREGKVVTRSGADMTEAFRAGALHALHLAQRYGVRLAVLKEKSPSCGSSRIYDGTFGGRLIEGQGIAAALLASEGIIICNEHNFHEFI